MIIGDHLPRVEVRAVAGRHRCAPGQAVARAAADVARAKNRVGYDIVPACTRKNLHQMPKDAEAHVAVGPTLANGMEDLGAADHVVHIAFKAAIVLTRVSEIVGSVDPAGVGEQVPRGQAAGDPGIGQLEPRQIRDDRCIEVETALGDQLEDEDGREGLGDRGDAEEGLGTDVRFAPADVTRDPRSLIEGNDARGGTPRAERSCDGLANVRHVVHFRSLRAAQ